jgi:hypothetical protein
MNRILFASLLALAGCTAAQDAQVATVSTALCKVDGVAQPIAVALAAPVTTPTVAGAVALDVSVIHPAIVAACAAANGTVAGAQ